MNNPKYANFQEDDEHFIDVAGGVEEDMQHEGGELQTRREPVDEQDEILNRLEREVIRRTKMVSSKRF